MCNHGLYNSASQVLCLNGSCTLQTMPLVKFFESNDTNGIIMSGSEALHRIQYDMFSTNEANDSDVPPLPPWPPANHNLRESIHHFSYSDPSSPTLFNPTIYGNMICPHKPIEWLDSKRRYFKDGSCVIAHSIIVNPLGNYQIHGPMCSLIAIYDSPVVQNNLAFVSPWELFHHLINLGWSFPPGRMLECTDLESISMLLEVQFEVLYTNQVMKEPIVQFVGDNNIDTVVTLKMLGAHYLNGDEL